MIAATVVQIRLIDPSQGTTYTDYITKPRVRDRQLQNPGIRVRREGRRVFIQRELLPSVHAGRSHEDMDWHERRTMSRPQNQPFVIKGCSVAQSTTRGRSAMAST